MIKSAKFSLLLATLLCCSYTQAKIYSWVDSDGKTHFSDIPQDNNVDEVDVVVESAGLDLKVVESKTQQTNTQPAQKQQQGSDRQRDNSSDREQRMPPQGEMDTEQGRRG